MSNEAPVSVPPEDLLVTRSMSAKAKAKTAERSRTVSMDTMELLRNLQEEKNKVKDDNEMGRERESINHVFLQKGEHFSDIFLHISFHKSRRYYVS